MIFHSGLSAGSSCWIVSTIRYMMLSRTLRSVLSAREMAGFLTALLQAALLLNNRKQIAVIQRNICPLKASYKTLTSFVQGSIFSLLEVGLVKQSLLVLDLHVEKFHQSREGSNVKQQKYVVSHPVLNLRLTAAVCKGT